MTTRRSLIAGAASALATTLAGSWPGRACATEHWVAGGNGNIQRGQFGYTPVGSLGGYGTINLPAPGVLYMIPLTVQVFDESAGLMYQMLGDGLVTIVNAGLYELTANIDWPAQSRGSGQDGYDVNLRELMVLRVPVGVAPPVYTAGQVTPIGASLSSYDLMASIFTPGSSVPNTVRSTVSWTPGSIPAGGMVTLDVQLPTGSFTPSVGDLSLVSHTALTDAALGAANAGLRISGRIVASRVMRVMIENLYNASAVTVPAGTLNVVAESATTSAGNSVDAWTWLGSGPVELSAGEKLMVAVQSNSTGDFLQIDSSSFLRVTNLVA